MLALPGHISTAGMIFAAVALVPAAPAGAERLAAPRGDPAAVAFREIRAAPYPCAEIASAARRDDGAIVAKCSDGMQFLIFRQRGYDGAVVLPCDAAATLGLSCRAGSGSR